ncbi:MAG: tyrosine-type recombinase/integrase, partial [bacterium]|nr:tyrosine-type recombinase/integrase [bacterium]
MILAHAAPQKVATGKRAFNGSDKGRAVYKGINANDHTDLYAASCLTGMRLAEARFLTWNDVDLAAKILLIRPGMKNGTHWQPKTRSSIRRIAIVPELEVILERLRKQNRKNMWVFESRRGTQLSADNPTERLREICDSLNF